jgi:hypothetical protein
MVSLPLAGHALFLRHFHRHEVLDSALPTLAADFYDAFIATRRKA